MKTIGIIGLGSIGSRHAKNLREMGHGVIGYDPVMKGQLGALSLDEVIAESDAIVIASPTPRHYFDICEVIGEGPNIFVEKPISDRIPDLESTFDHVTMVGYNLRFHSCVKKAKEWIDNGKIGKPLWAQFTLGQFSDKPPYLRDGVILNWSHELDLALYLLGHARLDVSSTRLTDGKDDISDIFLTHDSGCRSAVHLDYVTEPEIRRFTIVGTDSVIDVDLEKRTSRLLGDGTYHENDTWNENYIEEMQAFLDRCDGKETIGCTGKEGLEVLKICLEVRKQAGLE
jgi:predicted dehydrogenase